MESFSGYHTQATLADLCHPQYHFQLNSGEIVLDSKSMQEKEEFHLLISTCVTYSPCGIDDYHGYDLGSCPSLIYHSMI